jgi:hypothetical protein
MKILPTEAQLFHVADKRKDKYDEDNSQFSVWERA